MDGAVREEFGYRYASNTIATKMWEQATAVTAWWGQVRDGKKEGGREEVRGKRRWEGGS